MTPPPIKGTLAHPHNHSTVYSEHLPYAGQQSHRCSTVPQAAGAIPAGIPGGHQCQGQVPERKGPGQLSLGGRRRRKLHALDEGDFGCPVGREAGTGKGRQEDAGTVGEKGASEQAEQGGSRTLRAIPGKACPGPVVSGAPPRRSHGTRGEGHEGKQGREEAYHHLGLSSGSPP